MYTHVREVLNERTKVNTPKIERIRKILNEGLDIIHKIVKRFKTSKSAQKYEMNQIRKIGRVNLGTGPLLNLKTGDEKPVRKQRPVCQYNRFYELVATYPSTEAAANTLNIKWISSLANAVRGRI